MMSVSAHVSAVAAFLLCLSSLGSAQAVVAFSPTSVNFGPVQAGQSSSPQTVTLSNPGNATLNITFIAIGGNNATDYSITANTCGATLDAGGQCAITSVFKPTRTGVRTAKLTVTDDAAGSPQSVPFTGIAQTSPLSFTPQSLSFPNQHVGTKSASQQITVAYIGKSPLQITSLGLSGQNASDFSQTNNCGTGLNTGTTCTITVTFSPSAPWSRSSAIVMIDNAQGNTHLVGVSGNGVSGGFGTLSVPRLNFTRQLSGTTSPSQTATLTNTGRAPLQITSVAVAGDFAQTNDCPASLSVGSFCTVTVTFTPSYSGPRTGWVTFNLNDPASLKTLALAGTGALSAPVTVSPKATSVTPTQTVQYTAYLSGVQTSNVKWQVDGVAGGNSTSGTISSTGLYTPPAAPGNHTVTAINNAAPKQTSSVPVTVSGYAGMLTHHNDTLRTGQNNQEAALTTGNVNKTQFGKLFSQPVDGQVYAQPLWVPSVNVTGKGVHNMVIVATEHDSVYAFDADQQESALWQTSFINPPSVTSIPKTLVEVGLDLSPEVGITSTPVVDAVNGIVYVEARTWEQTPPAGQCNNPAAPNNFVHRLHALNLSTGAEMPGSPVIVCASIPGTGYDAVGGVVSFNTMRQNQRPALLLVNGVVYLGFGALEDIDYYHGWILGYSYNAGAGTLSQVSVYNDSPNGQKGGIWQGGGGLLADASGNIYTATGNGTFDANTGGHDYGTAFLKLTPNGSTLEVADYFSPFNQKYMNLEIINADLASAGPMLLPDQSGTISHLAVACGKTGTIYLMNRDNLGQYTSTGDNVVQALYQTIGVTALPTGNWGTPAYFNGQIYLQGIDDPLRQYTLLTSTSGPPLLSGNPMAVAPEIIGYPSPSPVISSNGTLNGIVWVIQSDGAAGGKSGTLRAYDAANVSHEIYNTAQAASNRDAPGPAVKFATPAVANGKVYVPTASELDVYGLLP